jgi:hypothetical protein
MRPPPKLLVNLFRLLLPPASREHVLGDLQERHSSPKSYTIEALSVLGPVIVSRIRRTTDIQVFLMETLSVYLSFAAAAWYLGEQNFLYHHAGFVRLAIPTSVAVVALLFCNAYSSPEKKSFITPILQSAGSLSLAFLGQAVVFDMLPNFAVPFPTLLYGSLLSVLLVSPLRVLFPPVHQLEKFAHPPQSQPLNPVSKLQRIPKFNLALIVVAALLAAALLLAPILQHA